MLERTGNCIHLYFDSVNDAFVGMVQGFRDGKFATRIPERQRPLDVTYYPPITKTPTRAGTCLSIEEPVTITYLQPQRRVLFGSGRDANPFFHMIEALWMLAGRNDIKHLEYYNSRVKDFSDDGETWYGAYGARWRHPTHFRYHCGLPTNPDFTKDQIERTIRLLKSNPNNRRIVITMWLPTDYERVESMPDCKDVPCNTEVMFRCRQSPHMTPVTVNGVRGYVPEGNDTYLDMTVINRSNDLVWGTLGSNYVTFSMLQEYIACSLGWEVGHYHQVSNNQHVYVDSLGTNNFNPERLLEGAADYWTESPNFPLLKEYSPQRMFTPEGKVGFDDGLGRLFSGPPTAHDLMGASSNPFLLNTVWPMVAAWHYHKQREYDDTALATANKIQADDWRLACQQWLKRRAKKFLYVKQD